MASSIESCSLEYDQLCDLLDEYFSELMTYNRMIGAFDAAMTPAMYRDAQRREALQYAKVKRAKQKLKAGGIAV